MPFMSRVRRAGRSISAGFRRSRTTPVSVSGTGLTRTFTFSGVTGGTWDILRNGTRLSTTYGSELSYGITGLNCAIAQLTVGWPASNGSGTGDSITVTYSEDPGTITVDGTNLT